VINAIAEIQKQIEALGDDVAGKSSTVLISDQQFRVQVQTLRQEADALPPVVGRLVNEIAENPVENVRGDVKGKIEEVYRDRIVTNCNTLVGNRYPFATTSAEVQLSDFGTVFGYDGLFDKFFTDYLEKQVDTTASVTFKPLASVSPVLPFSLPLRSFHKLESSVVTMMFRPATSVRYDSHSEKATPRVFAPGSGLRIGSM